MIVGVSGDRAEDLRQIAGMMAQGTLRAVIDSRFPLARIAEAHRKVESRHKTGAVVLDVDPALALPAAA